jgi:macrolide-specific efflux system membrane fusion protein
VTNNVVLYTALFDVDNTDQTLYANMTAQIFFVTSSAQNVLKVPVGALTYADKAGRPAGAAQSFAAGGRGTAAQERAPNRDPEMAERSRQRMAERQEQGAGSPRPRQAQSAVATVQVAISNDEFETREIQVGVTSRIAAEVLSGLEEGEQVVAGVLQSRAASDEQRQPNNNFRFR